MDLPTAPSCTLDEAGLRSQLDGCAAMDEQARTEPDGAPLPARGRRNIARMLDMAAWHERQLCLLAVDDEQIVGFVCASIDAGSGLLPGLVGDIDALYG